jgi:predicted phosphatase
MMQIYFHRNILKGNFKMIFIKVLHTVEIQDLTAYLVVEPLEWKRQPL